MPLFNPAGATSGDLTSGGNVVMSTVGGGLRVKEGTNGRLGTAVLVAGTVIVANTSVTTITRIMLSRSLIGGTTGDLSYTIINGTSFAITSTSVADTSTIVWLLVEPS